MEYTWDFSAVLANRQLLLLGVRNTVVLGLVCLVIGLFFGLFVGAARYSRNPVFHWPATAFVEVFRNTPVLVQIVWFFFAFPIISPFEINAFTAAALGLSLNTTAFCSEIYRAGIQSIARGQIAAGYALGLNYWQNMGLIVLPQAFRNMIPVLLTQTIILFQDTSLVYVISATDFLGAASKVANRDYRLVEMYVFVAIVYFVISYSLSALVRRLQDRVAVIR